MDHQLVATLVGGSLSLFGGFAATLYWRWADHRHEEKKSEDQLAGAINVVIAKLAARGVHLFVRHGSGIVAGNVTRPSQLERAEAAAGLDPGPFRRACH